MKKAANYIGHFVLFFLLTVLTQIGGLVYILSFIISEKWKRSFYFKKHVVFISLYFFITLLIVPVIAPIFGREKIKHSKKLQPTNFMTVLLNRNYVKPELNKLLKDVVHDLENTPIEIHYLDANFPFWDKFPLLPHLSHDDGKKIDLNLIYETKKGGISNKQKSISGYGVFEEPLKNEYNQISKCLKKGYFQYDFPKYLTLGQINSELFFSKKGTKILLKNILKNKRLGKLFIEPHLKSRLLLKNKKIRYHGCRAVRHDDHIHIQLK